MDSFKASAFFPKRSATKSKLLACIETNLPVFSQDLSEDGSKTFFCCGYEYFCNVLYKRENMRSVYEVFKFNKPTKIYLDFDKHTSEISKEVFEAGFCAFMNVMVDTLQETYDNLLDMNIPCVTLDASTEKKFSRHVILQVTMVDVSTVKEFVEYVLSKCPCDSVDTTVYTRNRSFRLLYSSKLGKNAPLRILGTVKNAHTEYNADHVFMCMIQGILPTHYLGKLRMDNTAYEVRSFFKPDQSRKRKRSGDFYIPSDHVPTDEIPVGIVSYINENSGKIRSAKREGDFLSLIVSGTYCPYIKGYHKHNNAYFTICTISRVGWWKCADTDCPQMNYDKSNLDWAI